MVASTASVFVASDRVRLGGTRKGLILRAFAAAPGLKAQGDREHTKGSRLVTSYDLLRELN